MGGCDPITCGDSSRTSTVQIGSKSSMRIWLPLSAAADDGYIKERLSLLSKSVPPVPVVLPSPPRLSPCHRVAFPLVSRELWLSLSEIAIAIGFPCPCPYPFRYRKSLPLSDFAIAPSPFLWYPWNSRYRCPYRPFVELLHRWGVPDIRCVRCGFSSACGGGREQKWWVASAGWDRRRFSSGDRRFVLRGGMQIRPADSFVMGDVVSYVDLHRASQRGRCGSSGFLPHPPEPEQSLAVMTDRLASVMTRRQPAACCTPCVR